jgi:signal transduction histidine kinase
MLTRFFAVFFILLSILCCKAQHAAVKNYTIANGLPSMEVYEVFQDSKGFIWFGTDNGVVKYDGTDMTVYQTNDGLTDPVVFGMVEDEEGKIWFRTFSGKLCYYKGGNIYPYQHNDSLSRFVAMGVMNSFYVGENNELWCTIKKFALKLDSSGKITQMSNGNGKGLYVIQVKEKLLIGNSNLFYPLEEIIIDNKIFPVKLESKFQESPVECAILWKGKHYVSINKQLFCYDGKSVKPVYVGRGPIISLSIDKSDDLWIGYLNDGVEKFSDDSFIDPYAPPFVTKKSVTKVLEDHEGGYWFTTLEDGVFYAPNLHLFNERHPAKKIKGFQISGSELLFADQDGQVTVTSLDVKIKRVIDLGHPILSLVSTSSRVFISTSNTICVYNKDLNKLLQIERTNANDISPGSDGYVYAISGTHIYKFSGDGKLSERYSPHKHYRSIVEHNGNVFLAGRTGLDIRNEKMELKQTLKPFENVKVSQILPISDTIVLLATRGSGFATLNTTTWSIKQYTSRTVANNIHSVAKLGPSIWFGTDQGLLAMSIKDLLAETPSFNVINDRSGLMEKSIAFIESDEKYIYAVSNKSIAIFNASQPPFAHEPQFYTRRITVNNQAASSQDLKHLPHDKNNIELDFGFVAFSQPDVTSRYRLNSEAAWTYTNDRKIQFFSLAPDQYNLELEYSTDGFRWKKAAIVLPIVINAPWWNKWYTYAAGSVFLVLVLAGYFMYQRSIFQQKNHYLEIINDHQQKLIQSEVVTLERERNRIAKELHDGVGTNLSAIKLTVNQLLTNYGDSRAGEVEEQFQLAINELKNIIYGLAPPSLERYGLFTALQNYINKISKNLPIDVSLKTYGYDVNNYELNIIIFRIVQELLSNSVKHSYAKNINIHISSFDDLLNLIYEDDGIGFKHAPTESGLGLDNIESRIQSVNGTFKFESGTFGVSYNIDIPLATKKEVFE